jgi:uncharacterized membrane protein
MNGTRNGRFLWVAATLAMAAIVHLGSLYLVPRLVMARALAAMGAPNTMHFNKRADAGARTIVRPSPDLLYSACPFDLAKGPLIVTARVPHWTYWSVSAFDATTNNFFVRNDREVVGDTLQILVTRHGLPWPSLDSATERTILFAPSEKGLILIRLLINNDKNLPALEALRRQARCETVRPVASGGRLG